MTKEIGSYFRRSLSHLSKRKMRAPFDPTIPLLGLCPTDIFTHVHKDTRQVIVPLFVISPYWIPRKNLPQGNDNLWRAHTVEYCIAVK